MKTLILNGSPRMAGDTAFLIKTLQEQLLGEVEVLHAYTAAIGPCVDCRYCWTHVGCCVQDEMQPLYERIKECDHIVIASPLYFSELTGPLLSLLSRLQMFYSANRFRNIQPIAKKKRGAVLLCGGGDGAADTAEKTAKILLRFMNAEWVATIHSLHTDERPSEQDREAIQKITALAKDFNSRFCSRTEATNFN